MHTIADGAHAKLSASGAYRWMVCPGSIRESEGLPNVTTYYAAEGTVAHEIAARCLKAQISPSSFLGEDFKVDTHVITVDQGMVDAVELYLTELPPDATIMRFVEHDLTPALTALHPDFGGMSDAIVFLPEQERLKVYDYKHGAGVIVEVRHNKQLMYYALGALLSFSKLPIREVEIVVVQPRCGHADGVVRSWVFHAADLLDFEADLVDAAAETEKPDAPLVPGPHCKFCPAAGLPCKALMDHQNTLMSDEFEDIERKAAIVALTPERIAQALEMVPAIEARISQLRELAYNMAMHGNPPPGFKLVAKRGRRNWTDKEGAAVVLEGKDGCWTEPALKTPAQVQKALGKAEYDAIAAPFVDTVSSGHTLVPESDPRAPAQLASQDDFEELT